MREAADQTISRGAGAMVTHHRYDEGKWKE